MVNFPNDKQPPRRHWTSISENSHDNYHWVAFPGTDSALTSSYLRTGALATTDSFIQRVDRDYRHWTVGLTFDSEVWVSHFDLEDCGAAILEIRFENQATARVVQVALQKRGCNGLPILGGYGNTRWYRPCIGGANARTLVVYARLPCDFEYSRSTICAPACR